MTSDEFIIKAYEEERKRLLELSIDFTDKPQKGCKEEWKKCKERLDVLERKLLEIPVDSIEDDKETGQIQQIFIGKIEGNPVEYFNSRDLNDKHFYIDLTIMGCGDEEVYKDKRFLRLSYKIWFEWFFYNLKYEEEKEQRIAKKLCTYVEVVVRNGEVTKLKWYRRYNPKK